MKTQQQDQNIETVEEATELPDYEVDTDYDQAFADAVESDDPFRLAEIYEYYGDDFLEELLENGSTPDSVFEEMAMNARGEEVCEALNPVPKGVIDILVESPYGDERALGAAHTGSHDQIRELSKDKDLRVRLAVIANDYLGEPGIVAIESGVLEQMAEDAETVEELEALSQLSDMDYCEIMNAILLAHPMASEELKAKVREADAKIQTRNGDDNFDPTYEAMLDEIATTDDPSRLKEVYAEFYPDPRTMWTLAAAPALPDDLALTMAKAGLGRKLFLRGDLPEETLAVLADSDDHLQRQFAAEHTTDYGLRAHLADDLNPNVRLGIVYNPNPRSTAVERVIRGAKSEEELRTVLDSGTDLKDLGIAHAVLRHPMATDEMCKYLKTVPQAVRDQLGDSDEADAFREECKA